MTIYRAWINQPSTQQPLHDLHGTHCIVNDLDDNCVDIYFTEGDVYSMRVSRQCISRGRRPDAEARVAA